MYRKKTCFTLLSSVAMSKLPLVTILNIVYQVMSDLNLPGKLIWNQDQLGEGRVLIQSDINWRQRESTSADANGPWPIPPSLKTHSSVLGADRYSQGRDACPQPLSSQQQLQAMPKMTASSVCCGLPHPVPKVC